MNPLDVLYGGVRKVYSKLLCHMRSEADGKVKAFRDDGFPVIHDLGTIAPDAPFKLFFYPFPSKFLVRIDDPIFFIIIKIGF